LAATGEGPAPDPITGELAVTLADATLAATGNVGRTGGTLRRHRRSVRWDDVPLELEPVVALAENYAGAADVQRAVDDALLRFARIGARTSVNRRATLIDEMRRAVVAAVERATEDDDEEALTALL
jgi:hypothetical protein